MTYGCGALMYDDGQHVAWYGARLIYAEVMEGQGGVVWDRQAGAGEVKQIDKQVFPLFDEFMDLVRSQLNAYDSGSDAVLTADFGNDVVFAASPQGSYGYLYLSAVVLR